MRPSGHRHDPKLHINTVPSPPKHAHHIHPATTTDYHSSPNPLPHLYAVPLSAPAALPPPAAPAPASMTPYTDEEEPYSDDYDSDASVVSVEEDVTAQVVADHDDSPTGIRDGESPLSVPSGERAGLTRLPQLNHTIPPYSFPFELELLKTYACKGSAVEWGLSILLANGFLDPAFPSHLCHSCLNSVSV